MATGNISYNALMQLHEIYLKGKRELLNPYSTFGETKSIWFKLDEAMRSFLTEALNNPEVDGIRTYILQYPDEQTKIDGELYPQDKDNVQQLTIGFVPTKKGVESSSDVVLRGDEEEAYNHGELCPSNCPPLPPGQD